MLASSEMMMPSVSPFAEEQAGVRRQKLGDSVNALRKFYSTCDIFKISHYWAGVLKKKQGLYFMLARRLPDRATAYYGRTTLCSPEPKGESMDPFFVKGTQMSDLIASETICHQSGLPYLMLPSRRNLKWLIPLANSDVAWHSLDLYAPAHISGKFYKLFLRCLTQISPVLNHQIIFLDKNHKTSLSRYIDSMGPCCDEKHIAISRGTVSARQKFTLQIMDDAGNPTAYLKVAKTSLARDAIQREANMLSQLAKKSIVDVVPRLLRLFEADGNLVLAQTAGLPSFSENSLDNQHWDFFNVLLDEEKMLFPKEFILQRDWIRRVQEIKGSVPVAQFNVLNETLAIMMASPIKSIHQCTVHGDFVPWNIHHYTKYGKDSLFVFDWEQGFTHGIPLFDACHFIVQFAILVHKWNPIKILSQLKLLWNSRCCKDYLRMADVDNDHLPLLTSAYFFEVLLDGIEIGEYPENSVLQKNRILCLELLLCILTLRYRHR